MGHSTRITHPHDTRHGPLSTSVLIETLDHSKGASAGSCPLTSAGLRDSFRVSPPLVPEPPRDSCRPRAAHRQRPRLLPPEDGAGGDVPAGVRAPPRAPAPVV